MNAVEKLQAAIDKLETLRAETTPGPWTTGDWHEEVPWETEPYWNLAGPEHVASAGVYLDGDPTIPIQAATADLIVTLHRTIDAQLAILRTAKHYVENSMRHGFVEQEAVALADAILGEE